MISYILKNIIRIPEVELDRRLEKILSSTFRLPLRFPFYEATLIYYRGSIWKLWARTGRDIIEILDRPVQ